MVSADAPFMAVFAISSPVPARRTRARIVAVPSARVSSEAETT